MIIDLLISFFSEIYVSSPWHSSLTGEIFSSDLIVIPFPLTWYWISSVGYWHSGQDFPQGNLRIHVMPNDSAEVEKRWLFLFWPSSISYSLSPACYSCQCLYRLLAFHQICCVHNQGLRCQFHLHSWTFTNDYPAYSLLIFHGRDHYLSPLFKLLGLTPIQ